VFLGVGDSVGGVEWLELTNDVCVLRQVSDGGAHIIGADGEFGLLTIDENGEFDAARATDVGKCIKSRTNRATGGENIVDKHNNLVLHPTVRVDSFLKRPVRATTEIVTVGGDIEGPKRNRHPRLGHDGLPQALREWHAPRGNAQQGYFATVATTFFNNLVRDVGDHP